METKQQLVVCGIGGVNLPEHRSAAPPAAWLVQHGQALQNHRGIESALVSLRSGLLRYGIEYEANFEGCRLGQDGVLGAAWLSMARAYLALLNGPTGRLDCGTLDGEVRRWATGFGFEEEV